MKKYLNIISSFIMLLAAIIIFYFFFLLFFPPKLTTITGISLTPTTIKGGQTIHVSANVCKKVNTVSSVVRTIETTGAHNIIVPYPVFALSAPVGCSIFELDTRLPGDLTPGQYQMDFTLQYQANPIRTINEDFYSKPFKVVQ